MTRQEIETLLPFLANDTLSGDERAQVQAAVTADPALQAELDALKAIRATMKSQHTYSPGEIGLARLMREVDASPATAPKRQRIWQAAAAALLAVVVGQGLMMTRSPDPAGYELAGEPAVFTIGFMSETTETQMRDLLLAAGVEITAGPSALGFYQLALLDGVTQADAHGILSASALVETLNTPTE